jgi:hypothetical protein
MHCKQPFENGEFFPHDNLPYCKKDFYELHGNRCKGCGELVMDKIIDALGFKWHPEHFVCVECKKNLAGGSGVDYEGEAHCKPCAQLKKAAKAKPVGIICARCKEVIEGEFIVLQGQRMHPYHFTCHKCKCSFKGANCHEYEGRLYCDPHYRELLAATCAQCKKPITGRSVTALGKQWHPEHFCCSYCEQPFGGDPYKLGPDQKPYCDKHYVQLFGKKCRYCRQNIADKVTNAHGVTYHPDHFLCNGCDVRLTGGKFMLWESKPMCGPCFLKLPKAIKEREKKINDAIKAKAAEDAKAKGKKPAADGEDGMVADEE